MRRFLIGIIATLAISETASASGFYGSLGAEVGTYETQIDDSPFGVGEYTGAAVTARLGYDFGRFIGVELDGTLPVFGSNSVSRTDETGTFRAEENATLRTGLFLRGRIPVSQSMSLFGRAGLGERGSETATRSVGVFLVDGTPFDESRESSTSDIFGALGGGLEIDLNQDKTNAIRFDFTSYWSAGGEDQNNLRDQTVSLAYVRRF